MTAGMRPASDSTRRVVRRLAFAGVLLCAAVVVLGAYVRLTAAGLGCPDWPGCYGHLTPLGAERNAASQAAFPAAPLDVGKAWREMAHRYAASTLGLIIVVIAAVILAARRRGGARAAPGAGYAIGLVAVVVFQGILGMLTVTWQLKPLIVTLHLLFGMTTLALLWWLWLSTGPRPDVVFASPGHVRAEDAAMARRLVLALLVLLGLQIALGGWTSSNYAAVACPDLPTCQGEWWPRTDYGDAFVLWRGLGVNYEGGVLDHPARVAIHLTHRIGAILTTLLALTAAALIYRRRSLAALRPWTVAMVVALTVQLAIALGMILEAFPLALAVSHNAGAAALLLAAVALYRKACDISRRQASGGG